MAIKEQQHASRVTDPLWRSPPIWRGYGGDGLCIRVPQRGSAPVRSGLTSCRISFGTDPAVFYAGLGFSFLGLHDDADPRRPCWSTATASSAVCYSHGVRLRSEVRRLPLAPTLMDFLPRGDLSLRDALVIHNGC